MREKKRGRQGEGRALIEDHKALEHLQLVLIRDSVQDLVVQLLVGERHLHAQELVGGRGPVLRQRRSA